MSASTFNVHELKCENLLSYLQSLPVNSLEKLYNHEPTCLAVYRQLPELAQQYVLRALFLHQPLSQTVVQSWVENKFAKRHKSAVEVLQGLHIWNEVQTSGGLRAWLLSSSFRTRLQITLLGGGEPWQGTNSLGSDKHPKDTTFLDNYSKERWECVLHLMVGSSTYNGEAVSSDTKQVLINAGLMRNESDEMSITQSGFQFLLLDQATQVWYFMLQYLKIVPVKGLDLVECLQFIFQLSFLSFGKDYSTDGMSDRLLQFLQNLRELGLVYQRKRKSKRFYPTKLAINLTLGSKSEKSEAEKEGFLVIETNYRVYAYTDSNLQIDLLGLFCELLYRFPNMSVGVITRDSVRDALRSGITASQIINYLHMHAHLEMLKHKPVIPPTIIDQIQLWELERDRFRFSDGVLYSQFLSQSDFELLRDYAKDLGVLVWDNPAKRVVVVTKTGHDDVKRFWKRQKKS